MDWLNWAALVATTIVFSGFWVLAKRRVSFTARTLLALPVGIALGLVFRDHVSYVEPIGEIYINVLIAIVAPLIIVSLLSAATTLGNVQRLRTIGLSSAGWLLLTNLVAVVLALGLALQFRIGHGAPFSPDDVETPQIENIVRPFTDVVVGLFPSNVVGDIANNNIIPIILFTLLIAVSYATVAAKDPEKVRPFATGVEAGKAIMYRAVSFIIRLTPYAVVALTTVATSKAIGRQEQVWSLLALLGLTYVACLLSTYVVNGVLLRVWGDVKPLRFFRLIAPAQVTAFTTQSSVGTLPVTTSVLTRKVGVPADIAGFTAPLGTTIGMPGCAGIWPVLVAVFGVHAFGIDYGLQDYLVLGIVSMLVSLGTAGVPGTATITTATVLVAVGLPYELLAITLPISTIADMARTLSNVTAAATATTIVARRDGRLDDEIFEGTKDYLEPSDDGAPAEPVPATTP